MRNRKKIIFRVIFIIIIIALMICGIMLYMNYRKLGESESKLDSIRNIMAAETKRIYVASVDIPAGSIIDKEDVVLQEEKSSFDGKIYMDEGMFGATALINIKTGSPILKNMLSTESVSNELKEYEISAVDLMADQKEYDCIDIRIMFADGSDYLVLSKKMINGLNTENSTFYTYCTESEIHVMSSAITDAGMYAGTKLYAVRYVESNVQGALLPNYPARLEVIDLILSDENVTCYAAENVNKDARNALDDKLEKLDKK